MELWRRKSGAREKCFSRLNAAMMGRVAPMLLRGKVKLLIRKFRSRLRDDGQSSPVFLNFCASGKAIPS
jgi:hypothetical protein